ncbi:cryptochrome/photolyase family protein [Patescibacteria group bacterium]|jgi:deoxyribodipyrimidine photolyase-related protein|nr:cryptochrome/photolyase family protein [Patescibacteria group bacterium]
MQPSRTALVFPHQLFDPHPLLTSPGRVVLVEDSLFFGDPQYPARFHRQKLLFHRASMQAYQTYLRDRGHTVLYHTYDGRALSAEHLRTWQLHDEPLAILTPLDQTLERRLLKASEAAGIELTIERETPYLLTPHEVLADTFAGGPPHRMSRFYEAQRRRLTVLIEHDGPVGGQWSFDAENRKKVPREHYATLPADPQPRADGALERRAQELAQEFPDNPGTLETFAYPTTHEAARAWLHQFLRERFHDFGPYEDAIVSDRTLLYHSLLSPLLNVGLLTPREVLDATLDHAQKHDIPLASLEGFIRQLIGWREFMAGSYLTHATTMRTQNIWNHTNPLPPQFYDGTTGLLPVDTVIERVLRTGYCHHIERLMVLGNSMFLLRIHPDEVYRWFMELFVDAYDWVMVPNVYAMSQNACGDLLTTKPYFSGSNYLLKMSDFPKGDWCHEWDALYWTFVDDNQERLAGNARWKLMIAQLTKKSPAQMRGYRDTANEVFARLGLPTQ